MNKAISKKTKISNKNIITKKTSNDKLSKKQLKNVVYRCEHSHCKNKILTSKDNKITPRGLYVCPICGCVYRVVMVLDKKILALVTRTAKCISIENPNMGEAVSLKVMRQKKTINKRKSKGEDEDEC